jgi:tetratricopeptide (TPR) repeat protein
MLAQLRSQGLEVPRTIPHPVMHVGIAKLALEEKKPAIAIANLRVALDKFFWSRHVRLLLARAMLAAERPDDCLYYVHEVLGKDPTDLEALELEYAAETSRGRRLSPGSRVEFLRSHPERREAVFGFLEHLVMRSAHDLALKVIERHRALLADRPAVRLLEARAHLGLQGYAKALAALEAIPPEATEYAEAISLAVETAAVIGDKTRLALVITRLTRCEAVSGDTLLRVAATLTERGHVSEALDVLRPVETDARRKEWRNGRFYTLLGRLRHAGGRVTEAQDQWNAAFSFPDGEEAGPLLAISHLLRNDEPAAREMLGYVAEPAGDPLLLAWLYQATGDGKRALALLKRFETESPLLRTLLTQALESVIEPGKPPSVTTFDPFLNRIVKAQPKRVFDCLALSRGMAFTAEAERAHAALVAAFPGADAWTQAALQTLHAFQDWLAGRELDAARTLLSVTRDSPLYYAAYDPLIALTENIAPDSLMQQDMIVRYGSLVVLGPDKLRVDGSQVPTMLFLGLAHAANKNGDFGQAANFLRLARGLDPSDVKVLTLLVEDARRRGDLDAALDLQLEAITWQGNAPTASSMRGAAELALIALERPEASKPETPLGSKVRKMLDVGRRYQETATEAERPPLGAIALLEVRLQAPAAGGVGPQNAAAVALLERFLQPYLLGSLPVHADLAGIQRVIAEMVARDHAPAALRHLRTLLERDPSLLELWLQRARLLEKVGDSQGAVDHLAWSVRVLPDPEALAEVARLMGLNPGIRPELRGEVLAAIEGCGSDSPELRAGRGLLELRLGRIEAAFASFEAASKVRLGPAETWLRDATLVAVAPETHLTEVLARMRALNADPARCPYPATEDIIHQLEYLERGAKTPGAPPSNK